MRAHASLIALSFTVAFAQYGIAQAPHVLVHPDVEFKQPFTWVPSVRELPAGGVIVDDQGEKQLWLVNIAAQRRTLIGHLGTGPLDYLDPWFIVAAGRQTIVTDYQARRYLILDEQGHPAETFPLSALGPGQDAMGPPTLAAGDNQGRVYLQAPAVRRTTQGWQISDSVPVLRVQRTPARVDTVAFIPLLPGDTKISADGGGTSIATGAANPFAPREEWAVTANGRVALVHAAPYFIEWIETTGKRTAGPTIPIQPIPVTDADKQEYAKHQHFGGSASAGEGTAGGSGQQAGGRSDWPANKPAFLRNAVLSDVPGNVWVLRANAAGDTRSHYDVFGSDGQVRSRIDLPANTRIVGFGRSMLYAARTDAKGARYLDVFQLPADAK